MTRESLPKRAAAALAAAGLLSLLLGALPTAHADAKKHAPEARCHFSRSAVCWMAEHRHL